MRKLGLSYQSVGFKMGVDLGLKDCSTFVLVLPQHFKNFPKEVEKFVGSYKKRGYEVKVIFNEPVPTK